MDKIHRLSKLAVTLFVIQLISGCALGHRKISLAYEPLGLKPQVKAAGKQICMVKFEDLRPLPELGEVRNGYGMKLASVYAENQDVAAWVSESLGAELNNLGFHVINTQSMPTSTVNLVISGSVTEVYAKMYITQRATITANVCIQDDRSVYVNRTYSGKASQLAITSSAKEYEKVLLKALHHLIQQVVTDMQGAGIL